MKLRRYISLLCVGLIMMPALAMAQMPSISVTSAASCVIPQGSTRVTAMIDSSEPLSFARVLFRAEGTTCPETEYFVEMRRGDGNNWWAVLPVVATGTKTVAYRIWARNIVGAEQLSPVTRVAVQGNCAVPTWSEAEQRYAGGIVLGLTREGQSEEPCGFLCNGIGTMITVDGRMVPNSSCRALLAAGTLAAVGAGGAAAATGATAAAIGAGVGVAAGLGTGAALLGAAGLIAGAALFESQQDDDDDDTPISPARP